jgi:hypothetical protein
MQWGSGVYSSESGAVEDRPEYLNVEIPLLLNHKQYSNNYFYHLGPKTMPRKY